MKYTFAVTTFNRAELTMKCFEKIIDDERIYEFLIVDDKSDDGSFEILKAFYKGNDRVRVVQNPVNIGMSNNKAQAILLSKCEWVIIADSDNVFDMDYLDAISSLGTKYLKYVMYLPIGALPNFDYKKYSNLFVDKVTIGGYMRDDMFRCSLNTCNCLVNREFYLQTFKEDNSIGCADTINHVYNHLKAGGKLYFVPNMVYQHLVGAQSFFLKNVAYNLAKAKEIENKIMEL